MRFSEKEIKNTSSAGGWRERRSGSTAATTITMTTMTTGPTMTTATAMTKATDDSGKNRGEVLVKKREDPGSILVDSTNSQGFRLAPT
ncbi:hypothetical protein Ddye_016682 [Dipteronia dyeriana]|uniref:Uncharacterized protein n=1 Tax=Dipteronia dyeriana TaxID=168575 RepID=A0AAD9U7Y1_9ROSI|nr:hypothetical protein Ddye_016682 [Dipteronia dyeriana]